VLWLLSSLPGSKDRNWSEPEPNTPISNPTFGSSETKWIQIVWPSTPEIKQNVKMYDMNQIWTYSEKHDSEVLKQTYITSTGIKATTNLTILLTLTLTIECRYSLVICKMQVANADLSATELSWTEPKPQRWPNQTKPKLNNSRTQTARLTRPNRTRIFNDGFDSHLCQRSGHLNSSSYEQRHKLHSVDCKNIQKAKIARLYKTASVNWANSHTDWQAPFNNIARKC